jgi:tripartite-type tricarboxylate transporter receptor subunit TctC
MMVLGRRQFLALAAAAAALPAGTQAQSYPNRTVRLVVGFPAGSSADIVARLIASWLTERLGRTVVVENRPGAGSNLAAESVVGSAADGHTLLWVTAANAISAALYSNLSFNFIHDIAPISGVNRTPIVLLVNPSVPATTVPGFISYCKANPSKVTMASGGNGTVLHVAGELFKMMTGVNMLHVPYRGDAPALTDLVGGQVQVMFGAITAAIGHIRSGSLRALGVCTDARSELFPDLPTVGEFVPGYEASGWQGVGAPRDTPAEIIDRLNREISTGLADPGLMMRIVDLGNTILHDGPAEFGHHIAAETEKWGRVVKFADLKP